MSNIDMTCEVVVIYPQLFAIIKASQLIMSLYIPGLQSISSCYFSSEIYTYNNIIFIFELVDMPYFGLQYNVIFSNCIIDKRNSANILPLNKIIAIMPILPICSTTHHRHLFTPIYNF